MHVVAQTSSPPTGLLFNSLQYVGFLALVVLLYWLLPSRVRKWLLLIASYCFYATWAPWFCLVLAATTVVNYSVARKLGTVRNRRSRRLLVGSAVLWALGLLTYFKYADFAIDSFASLTRTFGLDLSPRLLGIALPLGLSFYTFHTLSYVVDVYRRDMEPTRDLVLFGVFVAYFPQLLAGPITRARQMFPQFDSPPARPNKIKWQEGLELILLGLFQKVAVADALSTITREAFIDPALGPVPPRSWLVLVLAAVATVMQFVLDFAGYSNIARGTSKLMGIELPYNFREPLTRSRNMQDFWRRDHMTLFAWFRDYVYRPLRPRATTPSRANVLVIVVFVLSGLWHLAAYRWIVWGLFMGCAVVADVQVRRVLADRRKARERAGESGGRPPARRSPTSARPQVLDRASTRVSTRVRSSAYVIAVMAISMVLAQSPSLSAALSYYREILTFSSGPIGWSTVLLMLYGFVALVVSDGREHRIELAEGSSDPPTPARALLWAVMITLIIIFSGTAARPFVYFQF